MSVFASLLQRFGQKAVLSTSAGELEIRVFLQPVMGKTGEASWKTETRLGEVDGCRYYFFGPPDLAFLQDEGTVIISEGRVYEIIRAESFRGAGGISHWEALLKVKEEEADG